MLFEEPTFTGGDDKDDAKADVPEGNEGAIAGPESGNYTNPDVPGESEGLSNAQQ